MLTPDSVTESVGITKLARSIGALEAILDATPDHRDLDAAGINYETRFFDTVAGEVRAAAGTSLFDEFDSFFAAPATDSSSTLRICERALLGWARGVLASQHPIIATLGQRPAASAELLVAHPIPGGYM